MRVDGRYKSIVRYQGRRITVYGRTEAEARQKLAELERRLTPINHRHRREPLCGISTWDDLLANSCDRVSSLPLPATWVERPGRDDLAMLFQFSLTSDGPGAALVGLVSRTCLRLGKVAALCWGDIDEQRGPVWVRRTGQWIGGQ